MAEQQHRYDSNTPSYSLNDSPIFMQSRRNQHTGNGSEPNESNSPPDENEEAVVPILADVNDLLSAPGRTHLPVLCPDRQGTTTWFRHHKTGKIMKQILKMLKSDLPKSYPTYRSLPPEIKNRWFRAFAFNWDPSTTDYVRTHYTKQAKASFKENVRDLKVSWKEKGADNLPEWMKAKKNLFDGYIKMWTDEKAIEVAAQNSTNRGSKIGGLGVAKHNNGAKTYERCWDEMMELIQSQRQPDGDASVQPVPLTREEINSIMRSVVPKVRGKHYGFGNLVDDECPSLSSAPQQIPKLQEEIQTLKACNEEKDAQIKYLMECNKRILDRFPDIRPPTYMVPPTVEDDDDTTQP